MLPELEVRTLDGVRADVADGRPPRLVGTAIVYGVPSRDLGGFREVIAPDAARFDDLVALVNHDTSRVLGRVSARTLRVTEDARGLHFEVDPPAHAADVVESIARGDTPGVSFAFSGARDSWDMTTTPPTRTIHEMRVHELSLGVAFPAYAQAHAVALRSLASAKETPMPETTPTVTVTDPEPPVPVAVETRDIEVVGEERILRPADSFRAFVEREGRADAEFARLSMGSFLRALVTGPRNAVERRALAEGSDSTGGVTTPDITLARWIDALRAAMVVTRAGASVVPLTSDKTTVAKLVNQPVPAWRNENAAVAESDPSFTGVVLTPRSLAVYFKASRELLEDSINIEQMLERALTQSMALEVDRVALMGSGTPPQPQGLFGTSGIGSESMGTNGAAFSATAGWQKVVAAMGLVQDANADVTAMVMAPRTARSLALLADTTNQFQAPPSIVTGIPRLTTTAIPVNVTQGTSTDTSWILMGEWSHLYLGVRSQLRIEVLRERFAENLQYAFLAHLRMDVAVAHPAAFARLIGIRP